MANILSMTMKVMSAKDAKNSFGTFLDTAQREPVVVTKRDRPVGVLLCADDFSAMEEFVDSMRETVKQGVMTGLREAKSGEGAELTESYVMDLQSKLQERLNANKNR